MYAASVAVINGANILNALSGFRNNDTSRCSIFSIRLRWDDQASVISPFSGTGKAASTNSLALERQDATSGIAMMLCITAKNAP
jgi:hypothetical protein